jgi:hypothetical protein
MDFYGFWCIKLKKKMKIKKVIILIYFRVKNILKNNNNYFFKHAGNRTGKLLFWIYKTHKFNELIFIIKFTYIY